MSEFVCIFGYTNSPISVFFFPPRSLQQQQGLKDRGVDFPPAIDTTMADMGCWKISTAHRPCFFLGGIFHFFLFRFPIWRVGSPPKNPVDMCSWCPGARISGVWESASKKRGLGWLQIKGGERDEAINKNQRFQNAKGKTTISRSTILAKISFWSLLSIKMTLMTFWGLNSPQCWVWYIYANYMRQVQTTWLWHIEWTHCWSAVIWLFGARSVWRFCAWIAFRKKIPLVGDAFFDSPTCYLIF